MGERIIPTRKTWFGVLSKFKRSTSERVSRYVGRSSIIKNWRKRQLWRRFLRRLVRND